jgi:hypothetical protein
MGCQSSIPKIEPQHINININVEFNLKAEFNNHLEELKKILNNYNKKIIELEKEGNQNENIYRVCIKNRDRFTKMIPEFNKYILLLDDTINPYYLEVNNILKISKIEHILIKIHINYRLALILLNEYIPSSEIYKKIIKYIKLLDNIIEQCENRLKLLRAPKK